MREFQIARTARARYLVEERLFAASGNVILPDFGATRALATAMNVARDAERGRVGGGEEGRLTPVRAGDLNAMGLVDEILHVVVGLYGDERDARCLADALASLEERLGASAVRATLEAFTAGFPPQAVVRGVVDPGTYLDGATDGVPNREVALEELLLLWLANTNPAFAPFRELFDDTELAAATAYPAVVDGLVEFFAGRPPFGPDRQSLVSMLRSPAVASPDSLAGQLRYIRERWGLLLGRYLDRLVVTLDVIAEEEQAALRRYLAAQGGGGGSVDPAALSRFGDLSVEPDRFSPDREWMPRLVLLAKSTYVWLDQLSRRYGRDIRTLDAIPDEELELLSRRGFSGLWLIGLWERSEASAIVKRRMGNPEAVASAYSLRDYAIAGDLGGSAAYDDLRDRAWRRGIRLASDMVPNHMGIDSRWVVEHPGWFVGLDTSPFPSYSFDGPDLSSDERVAIQIEDHYWDRTDAAVVFKRTDRGSGAVRYIYHGNDGTSFPWNDTAQLDYLQSEVREAVIQTILHVARQFPIIRFDAAMTLAKRHFQRLWYPEPGSGGAIPSRAEHGLTKVAFEAAMPLEFWREVVDRVAAESPDTLLLAEAFWLMEGYFVRTLGMHRVYNSAFMNLLRDEDNAKYRTVLKNTLEFDPEILKRYVNFMNNPDERTAIEQFGKGDKYFGICTLLATMPGLPMFGHGQFEGFGEKYGMEYRRAYLDEEPDPWLVERHEREIGPLLHARHRFAEVRDFLLYDLVDDAGQVLEDVFAYSNGTGPERSLVLYHNRYAHAHGWLRQSVAFSERTLDGSRRIVRRTLGEGLGLDGAEGHYVILRDNRAGLEILRGARELRHQGLEVDLGAYACAVYLDVREVVDGPARQYERLAGRLGGRAVPSVDEALYELQLQPVHDALRGLAADGLARRVVDAATRPLPRHATAPSAAGTADSLLDEAEQRLVGFLDAVREVTSSSGDAVILAHELRAELAAVLALASELDRPGEGPDDIDRAPAAGGSAGEPDARRPRSAAALLAGVLGRPSTATWGTLLGWLAIHRIGALQGEPGAMARSRAWFDEMRLGRVLAAILRDLGLDEAAAWHAVASVQVLVTLPTPATLGRAEPRPRGSEAGVAGPANLDPRKRSPGSDRHGHAETAGAAEATATAAGLLEAWLADGDLRRLIRINHWEGQAWFEKEAFEELLAWAVILDAVRAFASQVGEPALAAIVRSFEAVQVLRRAGVEAGYRLEPLREFVVH